MRRVVVTVLALAAAAALVVFVVLPSKDTRPHYTVVMDNAFGLTEGVDLKAAGVRVGKVDKLDVQKGTGRALVSLVVDRTDFGSFRTDVFCRVQPQSLIGEYFMDCDPGRSPRKLPDGGIIPVKQTGTLVAPDLIANIMRRPFRERFGILLSEFGAGFATRGEDLNASIQRAIPALRETDKVLAILASERGQLRSLIRNGDTVLARLAGNRGDVARFVSEARDTARASANRRVALAQTFERFPGFLQQLRPTLRDLSTVARKQTPALRDLRASAPALQTLFARIGPFSEASRPALRSLGRASVTGRTAVVSARSTVAQTRKLAEASKDPMTNLRFVLEHLDDRSNAVETSPIYGGRRLTGLEAILQYPFVQSQAINLFDENSYKLKIDTLINQCTQYRDAAAAKANPDLRKACNSDLGPNQIGINRPDPTATSGGQARAARAARLSAQQRRAIRAGLKAAGTGNAASKRGAAGLADFLLAP